MDVTVDDWPSDIASDSQNHDPLTSDDESQQSNPAPRSRLRPAGSALTFVPFADWEQGRSYDGEPTIYYNLEWKLSVKNRRQAGESELHVVLSPRDFWKYVLRRKVADASAKKPWKEEKTMVVLSINTRPASKITKEFPKLDVNWSFAARQLREWSKFLNDGKTISITVTFHYECIDINKPGRGGATANKEADLEARTAGMSRGSCIKQAYALLRCPGRPCTKGDHCWIYEGKHFPLRPHHVRMIADHLQAGRPFNGHDDAPQEFRRLVMADEREQNEREQKERDRARRSKRRRRESDVSSADLTSVLCHSCALPSINTTLVPTTTRLVFPTSPLVGPDLSREDMVRAYSVWQRLQVSTEEQKGHYDRAQALTLEHCFDLDMLGSNQERMFRFYMQHDVPEGVAWRYVCDVKSFLKQRQRAQST
ncbi:hypothetical protein HJFPF1_08398 [Paramyrothecium foliicola]|nr:hypothetical protein HJFPF1_08398 [Paramyrothecium foliicola]